jgi:beta-glucosidase
MSVRFPRVCCPLTVRYGEGVFIGYRWYDARHLPVMFPFGHGLSYTTFGYDSPRLSASTLAGFGSVTLEPGETRSVEITIDPGAFAFWCVLGFPRWWLGHGARPLRGPGGFVRD